jgi:FixJ family two-component response regulator
LFFEQLQTLSADRPLWGTPSADLPETRLGPEARRSIHKRSGIASGWTVLWAPENSRQENNSGVGMTKGQGEAASLVFVVDDDASVRQAITSLLQSVDLRVEAFGSVADFLKKESAANGVAAACLVLDVRLPGVSGLDFQTELAETDTHLPIIFISGHGDIPMTVRAMKAGAMEFLTKPFRHQDLLDAVQLALQRDRDRRIRESAMLETRARFEALTAREREVFSLVTAGLMNKQVAGELGVSEITAKVHRGNVMRKMGARSLADLVRMADAIGIRQAQH